MSSLARGPALAGAAAAGGLQALAIAWPAGGQPLWWLQLASLAGLAALLGRAPTVRAGALLGWVFGTAWLAATFWWLFISMHVYGGLAAPLAALAVLLLAAALALYYAAAAALAVRLRRHLPVGDAVVFAALWLAAELLRGTLFTGFPWGAGGYAHVDGPLAFLAPWVGVYGIGAVAAGLAWLAGAAAHRRPARGTWGMAMAVMVAAVGAGNLLALDVPAQPRPPLTVTLLQGNIPQDEKFQAGSGIPIALAWYARMLGEARSRLVVAPETAIPLLPRQLPAGYLEALAAHFRGGERAALVGLPMGSFREGYTNTVLGLRDGAAAYRYDKHHLVPFGEFIPPLFKWFTRMMDIPLGDFRRGDVGQPSFEWAGERLAPNICYEDLFGEELAARFADPQAAPTILVNVSNIGWFGDTVAIDQHLHISRMRALEFARPVIRATNTGATAIIDARGRVTHRLPSHTRDALEGQVHGGGPALTPYAAWASRFGLWPLWLVALLVPLAAWARRRGAAPTIDGSAA